MQVRILGIDQRPRDVVTPGYYRGFAAVCLLMAFGMVFVTIASHEDLAGRSFGYLALVAGPVVLATSWWAAYALREARVAAGTLPAITAVLLPRSVWLFQLLYWGLRVRRLPRGGSDRLTIERQLRVGGGYWTLGLGSQKEMRAAVASRAITSATAQELDDDVARINAWIERGAVKG